jgi:hypothetical protein
MAGKTFPGIGDPEDESPPLDPADAADSGAGDSRPFYSGPTVVDDVKVEEGLKKLRSLDAPPGPRTGLTQAVVDVLAGPPPRASSALLSEPAPPAGPNAALKALRETTVGRNVAGPPPGEQVIPPFDDRALRGTLFGHSVHLPELDLPSPEEPPPPGALTIVDRGAPTTNVSAYPSDDESDFDPSLPSSPSFGPSGEAEPFARSSRVRNTPLTARPVEDFAPPRNKLVKRVVIGVAGIAAIVAAALVWTHASDDSEENSRAAAARAQAANRPPVPPPAPAPSAAAPLPAPSAAPEPVAAPTPAPAAREADSEPMPAAVVHPPEPKSPAAPVARPVSRHADDSPEPAAAAGAAAAVEGADPEARPHHSHSGSGHADRHHEAHGGDKSSDSETAPVKPTRSNRHVIEEDPDATMAPSIE